MSSLLARLGSAAATRPWRVIATWLTLLVLVLAAASAFGGTNHDDYNVPGLPSQQGTNLLTERFPEMSGADARVVVHSEKGPLDPVVLADLGTRLAEVTGVSSVSPPRLSQDSDTAVI